MAIDLGEVTGAKASRESKKETTQIANGLDKDAFMKLFLEQLKNQDPTSPMETDKIITQTAQLTQVEMQEENKKTMKEVAKAMQFSNETNKSLRDFQKDMRKSLDMLNMGMEENTNASLQGIKSNNLNAVSMIGKIAETDIMGLNAVGNGENHFSLYFDNKIDSSKGNPMIEIMGPDSEVVKTISLKDKNGMQGYIDFVWDGKDSDGNPVVSGSYQVKAHYNLNPATNQYDETRIGRGEVQSIVYDKGTPLMRLGDNILPVQSALEFYPKGESAHRSAESIKLDANKAMDAYKDDVKIESLSDRYNKLVKQKEDEAKKDEYIDEDTLKAQKEASDKATKAQEMKKYEKMLDAAQKGKQLNKGDLDKLSKLPKATTTGKDLAQAPINKVNATDSSQQQISQNLNSQNNPLDSNANMPKAKYNHLGLPSEALPNTITQNSVAQNNALPGNVMGNTQAIESKSA